MNRTPDRVFLRYLALITLFVVGLMLAFVVRRELAWIAVGLFLAVALDPGVRWINRRTPLKHRGAGVGVIASIGLLVLVFLGTALVPPIVNQTTDLAKSLPGYVKSLQNGSGPLGEQIKRYHLADRVDGLEKAVGDQLSGKGGQVLSALHSAFQSLTAAVTILVVAFFALLEGPGWVERFWRVQTGPGKRRRQAVAARIYEAISGYVAGNLMTSAIAAVSTSVLLLILGVPFAIALGLLVGILDLIPLVGATLAAVLVTLVALFHSVTAAIIMAVFYVIYQQVENHLLQPIVYGKTVQMSPLLVIVSIILGASLGGILGALVAIPIGAAIKILVEDYFQHAKA